MIQLPVPLPHEVAVVHPVRMKTRIPDWHDLANSEVGSEIDQDESGGEEQDFWEDLIYECVSTWVNRESRRIKQKQHRQVSQ